MKINDFKRTAYFQIEKVYVGGRNKLYQLSSDLEEMVEVKIGPRNSFDNMNKVLLSDTDKNRLITCNTSPMGACSTRNLQNISVSKNFETAKYLVATNESKITEELHKKTCSNNEIINIL